MTMNLFSIFDPSTSNTFNLNWLSMISLMIFLPNSYWIMNSRFSFIFKLINMNLISEFKNNFNSLNYKNFILFVSMFWFILFNNILGLYPYIFTATSHLVISLSLALPSWIIFMIYGWINLYNKMFSHLVPLGTPIFLSSFMVIIETVSNIIRPITLSVRLSANMIAGHLLLSLLSGLSEKMNLLFMVTLPILLSLLLLEYAVSFIQSYVFVTLLSLYFNEI